MSKRSKQNPFSGPNPKHQKQFTEEEPKAVRFRRNNQVIEDSDFNFGTDDQRAEKQHYVNEKGSRMKTGVNAIDSDDEEENAKQAKKTEYKKLNIDKVEGTEADPTANFDGMDDEGNMITGFNLKDEMEDGEFDSTGQFHFKKKKREDQDEWLDTVDWKAIKKNEKKESEKMDFKEPEKPEKPQLSEKEVLSKIVEILKPKETVAKALQRLGNKQEKLPAWKQKRLDALKRRQGKKAAEEPEKASEEDKKTLEELTSFVDQLARNGYYDIYTDSFEKIKFKLKKMDEKVEDDDLDMFGDTPKDSSDSSKNVLKEDSVKWEYKDGTDGNIIGPFDTNKMIELQKGPNPNLLCRRVNTVNFYNIARVDFDLFD